MRVRRDGHEKKVLRVTGDVGGRGEAEHYGKQRNNKRKMFDLWRNYYLHSP